MNDNSGKSPYLSIVLCSRNDNHGGNMLQRMQVSINGRLEQLEKHRIESELILIDWNPPENKPLLKKAIQWQSGLKYCSIRIIEVPYRIHRRYKYYKKLPIHVIVGINSGIRRARGKFVLPGLIDSICSDELMRFVASKSLKTDAMYRVDRCNVDRNVVQYNTLREQLNFCRQNIIRIDTKIRYNDLPDLHTAGSGDFQLMSRHNYHLLRGYRESNITGSSADTLLSYAVYASGVREIPLKEPMRIYHIDHDSTYVDKLQTGDKPFIKLVSLPFIPRSISFRLISLYRKYIGETKTSYYYKGVPALHGSKCFKIIRDILAGKCSYIFNDNTWGLAGENLPETLISLAEWERGEAALQ